MGLSRIGTQHVVTVARDARVNDIATLMKERSLGSVVVVEEGKPVGIVTDRDLVLRVLCTGREVKHLVAADIMSAPVKTVPEDAQPLKAAAAMREAQVRRLPIVDTHGRLVGILTLDDLFFYLSRTQQEMAETIGSYPVEHQGG
jgi:CBS domain-containing protein